MKDLRLVFQVINGTDLMSLNLKNSGFFKATLRFFAENFASKLDALGSSFYLLPYEERKKKAEQLIDSQSHTASALRDMIVTNSYQEVAEALEQLSKVVADGATIVVQAPRDIDVELKKEMREKLAHDFPLSFPVFQINRQLIGGFRVFINGQSHDFSWFSQVQKLTSLKS
jgi:F0F1-type ATP synthase delta subunit